MNIVLTIYVIGSILAGILGLFELHLAKKNNENCEDFAPIFSIMLLLSWISLATYFISYLGLFLENQQNKTDDRKNKK